MGLKADLRKSGTIKNLIHRQVLSIQGSSKVGYEQFDEYVECGYDTDMAELFERIINTKSQCPKIGGCSVA